jgi:hypothetical protein
MSTISNAAPQRAAAIREQRAQDARQAMHEYEAEKLALQAKTERLRALRLAKEAADAQEPRTRQKVKRVVKSS